MPRLIHQIQNLFFPAICEICGTFTPPLTYVCKSCETKWLPPIDTHSCLTCGTILHHSKSSPKRCINCLERRYHFQKNVSALPYQHKMKELLLSYKFGKKIHLSRFFARQIIEKIYHSNLSLQNVTLTYVPIHPKRFKQRGFNQAQELARHVAQHFQLPFLGLLSKTNHTVAQALLDHSDREKNIQGVFTPCLRSLEKLKENTTIWLIDDVFTTGATVNECAKMLSQSPKITSIITITAFHG